MESKKEKKYKRLELFELQSIFVMKSQGKGVREIAKLLHRGASSVSNVLNKHRHPHGGTWLRMSALERAKYVFDGMKRNRSRRRKLGHIRRVKLREYVVDKLVNEGLSPEEISKTIVKHLPGEKVSTKTIYTFIKKERPYLAKYLFEKGKPRRQRVMHRRGRFKQGAPKKRSIHERPEQIDKRQEVGHWEGDTLITKRGGRNAVLSLIERTTRQRVYRLIPNLEAETVLGVIRAIFEELPEGLTKSITFDNGSEFAYSTMINLEAFFPGLMIYYCDSYSSWQKGSVENSNREFRWYHPKGTDFGALTPTGVRQTQEKINRKPMKPGEGARIPR